MSSNSSMMQVCIICLDTESKLYVMNKYKLEKAYENLTGYSMCDKKRVMTQYLCFECKHRLVSFSKFRYKSLRARSVMDELLRNYQLLSVDYIKLVDRNLYQLKSDIQKTVFEPNHCDLYIDYSDSDVTFQEVAVKNESLSIDEDPTHMNLEHDAYRQTNLNNKTFGDAVVKIEKDVYEDCLDIESDILNEYDCYDHTNNDVTNDDNLSDSTLVLDTKPNIEELFDHNQNNCIGNIQTLDTPSEPNNGRIQENNNPNIEDTKLDNMSSNKKKKKLKQKLVFETTMKNFTLNDESRNINDESKLDDTKNDSRIKVDKSYTYWESNSDQECNLLVKREEKQDSVKLKREPPKPYSCKICNYKCKLKISLTVHMRTHKDEKYFSCELCDYKSKLRHSINIHMLKHTDVQAYVCDICGTKIKNRGNLLRHMEKHYGETLACNLCEYKTPIKRNFTQHMKRHTVHRIYTCQLCDFKCHNRSQLNMHMWSHTHEKVSNSESKDTINYIRKACSDKVSSYEPKDLETNVRNVCNNKISINKSKTLEASDEISSCDSKDMGTYIRKARSDKVFSCETEDLETDIRNVCNNEISISESKDLGTHISNVLSKKCYACQLCSAKFLMKGHLNRHMLTHTGEKPFVCYMCEQRFSQKVSLQKHMLIHNKEKPFSCDTCSYKCVSNIDMVKHKRTHTGEKPYACKYCDFRCNTSYNLVTHTRSHTGEKPFACKLCAYKCTRTSQLVRHMRTHTGEKRFKCDLCHYKCTRRCNLQMHMRVHTGEMFSCDYCPYKTANKNCLVVHIKRHMQLIAEAKVRHRFGS